MTPGCDRIAMSWSEEQVEQAFVEVRKRAMTDQAFRQLVLANPHQAIEEVSGKEVPTGFKIKVVESDPAYDMTYVLPEMASEELSDDMLDNVAGGIVAFVAAGRVGAGACAAAVSVGPCAAYACGADANVRLPG